MNTKKTKRTLLTGLAAMLTMTYFSVNAQWITSGNIIRETDTTKKVSIGTATNNADLYVYRNNAAASLSVKSGSSNAILTMDKGTNGANAAVAYKVKNVTTWNSGMISNNNFSIKNVPAATFPFVITQTDKVGIGTDAPDSKLQVLGGNATVDTTPVVDALVKFVGNKDIIGVQGTSQPAAGFGIGVAGNGNFTGVFANGGDFGVISISGGIGVDGEANEAGNTLNLTGVQGFTSGGDISVGVYGNSSGANTNYSVYGDQQDTANSPNYAVVCLGDLYYWRAFQASDARLKTNIHPLTGALDKIAQLNASIYSFNHSKYPGMALPGGLQIGLIADNVEQVFPNLIKKGSLPAGTSRDARGKVTYKTIPDVKAVNYIGLIPVLAEAIKEQKQIVDAKDAEIVQLKSQVADINTRLATLENTSAAKVSVETNSATSLEQNNPNPFNTESKIKFYIPSQFGSAQVVITDLSGQQIKMYNVKNAGRGEIIIHANELTSGNYIYTLIVDGKKLDSKQMELVK